MIVYCLIGLTHNAILACGIFHFFARYFCLSRRTNTKDEKFMVRVNAQNRYDLYVLSVARRLDMWHKRLVRGLTLPIAALALKRWAAITKATCVA
jgi:hypothetical protein